MSLAQLFYAKETFRERMRRWRRSQGSSAKGQGSRGRSAPQLDTRHSTRNTSPSLTPHVSRFTLESLEPRVLLSATPTELNASQPLEPAAVTVPAGNLPSLDVDLNGTADALSDGIVIIRHLFGFTGNALTNGAVDPAGQRTDPTAIQTYLTSIQSSLDVDRNGQADALSDGIVILRSLFGFTGTALTSGAVDPAGQRTDPTAIATFLDNMNPQREQVAPLVTAGLQQDTGISSTDGITFNPTITGTVADINPIASFTAGFDTVPLANFANILTDLHPDGTFTLSTLRLSDIWGSPLPDGPHTLHLRITDANGNLTTLDRTFILDRISPANPVVLLAPESDSLPQGDNQTAFVLVNLNGQTEPGAQVTLTNTGATSTADAGGQFRFVGVPLQLGANLFQAQAIDMAGNASVASLSVTRDPAVPGLVAAYGFLEGKGETLADASGNGLIGTLTNGPTWMVGHSDIGLSFDGVDDYVDLGAPAALQITGSLTLSAWVNASAFPVDDAAVISKRTSGTVGFQLDITPDTGGRTISFKLTNSAGGEMFRYGVTTLQLNTWYYIAGVYDAATQSLHAYLNGVLDDGVLQGTVTASQQNSSTTNVTIGRRAGTTGYEFAGRLDDVRIYDRALTAVEIQADMLNSVRPIGSSDFSPPVIQLDQPAQGTLVSDIVVVGADATDNVGIAGVQFSVDGVETGLLDTTTPYGMSWDTRTISNGAHTLTARAYDTSGNSTLSAPVTVNVSNTNLFRNEILATGFTLPTVIKFLPDGRLLVAEIAGTIKVLSAPYTTPDPTPFLQLNLNIGGYAGLQQGIMDVTLDPNFVTNHYYYVFYTNDSPNKDRLSRFTANSTLDGTIAGSEVILYEDPQLANTEHHGGAINFGNDGKIYLTTGDHMQGTPSQDLTSPRGKILRFNPDGTVPTDNPFYDGNGPNYDAIWALGLRNPYRAYYDAPTGRLFIGDVGGNDWSTAMEEVNLGVRGANYGWPAVEGNSTNPAYTNPLYTYAHNGRDAAVTGGFVYHGSQFPSSYQGSYFFADYTQNWIKRLTFDANGNVTGVFNFEPADGSVDGPYGDIVYLTEGPDGALYYLDLGYSDVGGTFGISKVRRIEYIQSDLPPVVQASATPTEGVPPLTVTFSSAGSSDPEGQPLTYSWTFGDGQTSTLANPQHTYASAGIYQARLTVSDGVNSTISPPTAISVGHKPVITTFTTTPANNGLFRAGDVVSFSAAATDIEDGLLPASAFTWNIDFLHGGHVHPGVIITGTSGTFTIPTSGHDFSGDTRYRIMLTVTDSTGLQATQTSIVFPDKVNLTFDTAPGGLAIYLDGIAHTAPFIYDTLIGFNHTIEARDQTAPTGTYAFASWSDGGARQHTITVPAAAQSYTAIYTLVTTPLPSGLAAGWNFNETSGTSATDSSGNGNTATLVNGVARTAGNYGGGLTFDGVNDYLAIPNSPSLDISGTGLTLSMWINPQALSGGDSVVLGKFWNTTMTSPHYQYGLELQGGTVPVFYVGTMGGPLSASLGSALALNQWSYLAVVFDGLQVRYYVNGLLVTTVALQATITARSNPFQIGADNNTQQFFKGSLDEVRIYSRALTAAEVQSDMVIVLETLASDQGVTAATALTLTNGPTIATTDSASLTSQMALSEDLFAPIELPSEQPADNLTRLDDVRRSGRFVDLNGRGMTVVMIDTGIDVDHPFFGPDADHNGIADRIVYQWDFADNDADASDRNGHGSHVASLIGSADPTYAGVAPDADLIALKVFKDSGPGNFAYVEQALQWVVAHAADYHIDVVNMSLGDGQNWTVPGAHYGIGDELATLANEGVLTIAAAGNNFFTAQSQPGVAYPAADPNVIGVGAVWTADFGGPWRWSSGASDVTTGPDRLASFSQRDPLMTEVFAPGVRLVGANQFGGTSTMQGTSQAAAYLSGTAILAQQLAEKDLGHKLTPEEFVELVTHTGKLILDGDDENNNVVNTGLAFHRVNVEALACEILRLKNDPPVVQAATFELGENSLVGTVVGQVQATDPDPHTTLTYAITAGNERGAFAIDLQTGVLTVANQTALDFESTPNYQLTVEATDDGSPALSGQATLTIHLRDANEAPVVQNTTFSLPEHSPLGTVVGQVQARDPDAGTTLTYAIVGGNTHGALALDPVTGVLTVASRAALNYEVTPECVLTVQVFDTGTPGLSGTGTITVNVVDRQDRNAQGDRWLWEDPSERQAIAAQQAWVRAFVGADATALASADEEEEELLISLPG